MENVSYIIPLHIFDKTVKELFTEAVKSIAANEYTEGDRILLVGPKAVIDKAETVCTENAPKYHIQKVENKESDFFKQINVATLACVTPYFTILEYDDTFYPYWNTQMQAYAAKSPFLISLNLLKKDGKPFSLANEIALSTTFAGDYGIGVLDTESLKDYVEFNLTGGLFKTEDFLSIGGVKTSLKLMSWYEFMLRAAYQNKPLFVVPKITYNHTINREGSYMETIGKNIDENEAEWLITTARQEYFFKEDRNKTYQQEKGEGAE
jgi:hypothetical protein